MWYAVFMTVTTCAVSFCDRPVRMKDWCMAHYHQQWAGKEFKPIRERKKDDESPFISSRRRPNNTGKCIGPECERLANKKKMCAAHYAQQQRGRPLTKLQNRNYEEDINKNPKKNLKGYIEEFHPEHPNSWKNGWMFQHVFVMSESLGRPIKHHENVHHINGIRDDNRIENLELWSTSQPSGQRIEDKTKWAIEWLEQYDPSRLK
ncbi:MAG: hypothetical protein E6R04_00305 [Spirochaetes bacterium]|nr:MAG: hypothetical protein E6R04_00305 [Spirochaetota bacterium]